MGFYEGNEFLRYIAEHDKSKTRWDNLETGAFVFWYRGSPRPLAAGNIFSDAPIAIWGVVWTDDPPLDVSGMTLVQLNPLGRLTQFIAVPPQVEKPAGAASSPDWAPLFSAAGLDPSKWPPAQPTWTPPVYSDARAAWTGSLAERPNIPMRIEAAAYRGKPVYFELIGPWTRPERMQPYQLTAGEKAFLVTLVLLLLSMLVVGAMLARRNLRLGRGTAGVLFVWRLLFLERGRWRGSLARTTSQISPNSCSSSSSWLGACLVLFSVGSLHCLGAICAPPLARHAGLLEPLAGGRLSGSTGGTRCACGLFLWGAFGAVLNGLAWFVSSWLGHPPPRPHSGPDWQFLGARSIIADISNNSVFALFLWLAILFVLFLFRALLRKEWAAAVAWVLFLTAFFSVGTDSVPVAVVENLIVQGVTVFLLRRLGLLWLVVAVFVSGLLTRLSPDDPRVRLVCGHQSGRNSADGRDGVLRLLHLPGRPAGFRRCRARGVSCAWEMTSPLRV